MMSANPPASASDAVGDAEMSNDGNSRTMGSRQLKPCWARLSRQLNVLKGCECDYCRALEAERRQWKVRALMTKYIQTETEMPQTLKNLIAMAMDPDQVHTMSEVCFDSQLAACKIAFFQTVGRYSTPAQE